MFFIQQQPVAVDDNSNIHVVNITTHWCHKHNDNELMSLTLQVNSQLMSLRNEAKLWNIDYPVVLITTITLKNI